MTNKAKLFVASQQVLVVESDGRLGNLIQEKGRDMIGVVTSEKRSWTESECREVLIEAGSWAEAHDKAQELFDEYARERAENDPHPDIPDAREESQA